MNKPVTLLGPILNPRPDATVDFYPDGCLQWNAEGIITFVGDSAAAPGIAADSRRTHNLILPPFLDCHIHIPQWPIRGKFCDGVKGNPTEGRLLAGLNRNVFPYEAKCAAADHAAQTIEKFAIDTLTHGVVGGAAYMTVHTPAVELALQTLSSAWRVGLVMMNMNCPQYLRTDELHFERDVRSLAERFGRRFIVTDRFAVAVDSPLRRRAVNLARELGLRMQTHLNEQPAEKAFVEKELYPSAGTYTNVYQQDGLLDCAPILAHCVHMHEVEFDLVMAHVESGACIAHCPTSNSLLGSGIMPLDRLMDRHIPYAICTDVGASPTTSILNEMAQFLKIHANRSGHATPSEALFRTTFAAAEILGLEKELGTFAVGQPASFIEVQPPVKTRKTKSVDDVILHDLLEMTTDDLNSFAGNPATARLATGGLDACNELNWITRNVHETTDRLDRKISAVTLRGEIAWQRK